MKGLVTYSLPTGLVRRVAASLVGTMKQPTPPPQPLLPVRYCLYARKSTEEDERQAMSIDSQLKEMGELALRENLNVVEVKRESHSAKSSGTRVVFNQLAEDLRSNKFDGILTWAPDRLSRNAGDLGTLVDLMDRETLREIRTHSQRFTNNPNEKFLLMILCSQAKLENDNKSVNVKRGMRAKCERGLRPCVAPIGYLNQKSVERGKGTIVLDPIRAPVVREMFRLAAEEGVSGRQIQRWLDKTGCKSRGGKRLSLSHIFGTLREPFYTGMFEYPVGGGQWYQGAYEPIITKDTFEKVQTVLNSKIASPNVKPYIKEFDFTRLITCGGCGSGIGAQEKTKTQDNGIVRHYVYYYCNRSRDANCKEPYIRKEELIKQLLKLIDDIDVDELRAKKQLTAELERFHRFTTQVLENQTKTAVPTEPNLKNYARYLLTEGSRLEKQEVLGCLKGTLVLQEKIIAVARE